MRDGVSKESPFQRSPSASSIPTSSSAASAASASSASSSAAAAASASSLQFKRSISSPESSFSSYLAVSPGIVCSLKMLCMRCVVFFVLYLHFNPLVVSSKVFNADGEISQVSFAKKAAKGNKIRCLGISCSDGAAIVSAIRNNDPSESTEVIKEMQQDSLHQDTRILMNEAKHLFRIDQSITTALCGIPSDCRNVLRILRKEAQDYRSNFGESIPLKSLAERLSSYLHSLTLSSDTRPLAVSVLICARAPNVACMLPGEKCSSTKDDSKNKNKNKIGGEHENRINSPGGELVKITCDGSYEFYHSCFLDIQSEGEDEGEDEDEGDKDGDEEGGVGDQARDRVQIVDDNAALTKSLQGVQWHDLKVEKGLVELKKILRSLDVDELEKERAVSRGGKELGAETPIKRRLKRPYFILDIMKTTK